MADAKAHATGHAHDAAHGDDEYMVHAHISSVRFYVGILAALMTLTLLTVGVASIHLGKANLLVAVLIASIKATLVVMFFMHLKYDNKFNATILICCLFFIGVFFAYTLNDTETRGMVDDAQGSQVLPQRGEVAPGGMQGIISPERSHENLVLPSSEDTSNPLQQQVPASNRSVNELPGRVIHVSHHDEKTHEGSPDQEHKPEDQKK